MMSVYLKVRFSTLLSVNALFLVHARLRQFTSFFFSVFEGKPLKKSASGETLKSFLCAVNRLLRCKQTCL